jgi:hypothetical protein
MAQSDDVRTHVATFREDEALVVGLGKQLFSGAATPIFPLDFLAFAALKRCLSTMAAIRTLVEAENMLAARAMLRVHIDTVLRFAAAWFVNKPHDFASAVIGGERIDKMKDRQGQQLRDARLVELLTPANPWLPKVYENLSGYIHFSGQHVAGSITGLDDETRRFSVSVSATDEHYPDDSWIEILDCAHKATGILTYYMEGWIRTKALSPEQLAQERFKQL